MRAKTRIDLFVILLEANREFKCYRTSRVSYKHLSEAAAIDELEGNITIMDIRNQAVLTK